MRWGDKYSKTPLIGVEVYIGVIRRMEREQNLNEINVFLCTEDPVAVAAFLDRSQPLGWNIYIDHFYSEYESHRLSRPKTADNEVEYNLVAKLTLELKGKPGLWAIGSILVAMESKYYVLNLASNWSRIYNELRKNVVHPRCNNCTVMIDVVLILSRHDLEGYNHCTTGSLPRNEYSHSSFRPSRSLTIRSFSL